MTTADARIGAFEGFGERALDFYEGLAADNSRSYWQDNQDVYSEHVAGPLQALAAELAVEFGQPKIFRPYRDLRFSADKRPYQEHASMSVSRDDGGGLYFALSAVGLDTWAVVTSSTVTARMATKNTQRLIRVREDGAFSRRELRRLIVHEIGTHVFRYENASRQPIRLLAHGLDGYLRTEEGMAVWQEANAGLTSIAVMRLYALRYIACDAAVTGDFCAVVDALVPHTSLAESYEIAMRVKRGLTDTSAAGGYLKDQVYFAGHRQVTRHLAGYPDDYPLLMASKWPVEQIGVLRRLRDNGLIEPPHFRPADLLAAIDW